MERYKSKRIEQLTTIVPYDEYIEGIIEQEMSDEQITDANYESVLERLLERDRSPIKELSARILSTAIFRLT
jgi:hypothetical protein